MASDTLDEKARLRFAWRITPPDDEPAPEEEETHSEEELRAHARAECESILDEVGRAWSLGPGEEQREATIAIALRAWELGMGLCASDAAEQRNVQLARLIVAHYAALPEERREDAASAIAWLELSHPDVALLVMDMVNLGQRDLEYTVQCAIGDNLDPVEHRALGARLAEVLDTSEHWDKRAAAASWLAFRTWPESVHALRRALRLPHLELRHSALQGLLAFEPTALTTADTLFLLEDAVDHPLVQEPESALEYAWTLRDAVGRVPPEGGAELLESILFGDCAVVGDGRFALDDEWALQVLAAGYPERAVPLVDSWLEEARALSRRHAIEAAARLPRELGEPRLLAAAHDFNLDVAHLAVAHLEKLGLSAGASTLAADFLVHPPTNRFVARYAALRDVREAGKEVGRKLLPVLLGEAPNPEALLLLLLIIERDGGSEAREATRKVLSSFGDAAVRAMCKLAARYPSGSGEGWMHVLREGARESEISEAHWPLLREVATRAVLSASCGDCRSALALLSIVGPTDDALETLWELATEDTDLSHEAASALALADSPDLDGRVLLALAEASAERDYERFERVLEVARARPSRGYVEIARELIARVEEESLDAATACARALLGAGDLSSDWVLSQLGDPARVAFAVGSALVHESAVTSRAIVEALSKATSSGDAHVAALAAAALIRTRDICSASDARLLDVLGRASPEDCADVVACFCLREPKLGGIRAHVLRGIKAAVPSSFQIIENLGALPRGKAILRDALADGPPPEIEDALAAELGLPTATDVYWVDAERDSAALD